VWWSGSGNLFRISSLGFRVWDGEAGWGKMVGGMRAPLGQPSVRTTDLPDTIGTLWPAGEGKGEFVSCLLVFGVVERVGEFV
jgi:hypothetical protein